MTKNYTTPLNIQIINKGNKKDNFIPYRENENFALNIGEKLSFTCNKSEKTLYYLNQASANLDIITIDTNRTSDLEVGIYNKSKHQIDPCNSYIVKMRREFNNAYDYQTYGVLPYNEAISALNVEEGNQIAVRILDKRITQKSDIDTTNPGHIVWNTSGDDPETVELTLDDFANDGSLTVVKNINSKSSYISIGINVNNQMVHYNIQFYSVDFAKEGEELPDINAVDIAENQNVTLTNISEKEISFIPYKENFAINISAGDSIVIQTKVAEEAMYYLLQANDVLAVTL